MSVHHPLHAHPFMETGYPGSDHSWSADLGIGVFSYLMMPKAEQI